MVLYLDCPYTNPKPTHVHGNAPVSFLTGALLWNDPDFLICGIFCHEAVVLGSVVGNCIVYIDNILLDSGVFLGRNLTPTFSEQLTSKSHYRFRRSEVFFVAVQQYSLDAAVLTVVYLTPGITGASHTPSGVRMGEYHS